VSNNLLKRTITGAILVFVVIFFLWLDNVLLPLALLVLITFATNEYFRLWHRKDIYPHTLAVLLPAYTIPLLVYFEIPLFFPVFLLFIFVCLLSVMRFPGSRRVPNFLTEIAAAVFGIVYLTLLPVSIILLRKIGLTAALYPLVLTWLYDTFAYFIGSKFGRHKLASVVSPKKSWEGTLFALPLTLPLTILFNRLWLPALNFFDAIVITLGIGIFGTLGDLLESGMKREVGLKDTSKVFPGHGGILDRLDSLILNVPFFYLYLIFVS
jgi:phosphatidate cytidylyltransferase